MKLFAKGKGGSAGAASQGPSFQPIDRTGLLGFLDQLVNGGQSGVLELREPRGAWTYAFQNGALTHASGGRVRGARQAFDLLWEFGNGEFQFTPGTNTALAGNLYIDKGRLLDLLRRSQAVLQGPASPYIAPEQQRPIAPVQRPYSAPTPGQIPPQWQPAPGQPVQGQPPMWPGTPQPGQAPAPAWGNGAYPPPAGNPQLYPQAPYGQNPGAQQPYPPQPYPQQPYPQQPYPQQPYPQPPYPQAPQPPAGYPQPYHAGQHVNAPTPAPQPPPAPLPQAAPPAPAPMPRPAPAPSRQVTPPTFSVPPMAIPKRKEPAQLYQPPVAPASAIPPVPEVMKPAAPTPPKDDLQALRASLVAEAPAAPERPAAPSWGVRTADGSVAPATTPTRGGKPEKAGKPGKPGKPGKAGKGQKTAAAGQKKAKSKLRVAIDIRLIKFLLWACERKYSADDHWTLKDAFEVSTMELRDQFIGAFSESFKSRPKSTMEDDDLDQMAAGRMRGRGRKR